MTLPSLRKRKLHEGINVPISAVSLGLGLLIFFLVWWILSATFGVLFRRQETPSSDPTGSFWSVGSAFTTADNSRFANGELELVRNQAAILQRQYLLQFAPPTAQSTTTRRRRVILSGPHDRFNFGDLLFEKVVSKLLKDVAGFKSSDIIVAGMMDINMSEYGGHPHVISIKKAIQWSHDDVMKHNGKGPYNVVYLGGQMSGTTVHDGVSMILTEKVKARARRNSVTSCAYMFPKELLLPESLRNVEETKQQQQPPIAVVNGVNMRFTEPNCTRAMQQADFVAFRDYNPNPPLSEKVPHAVSGPDCAVMVNYLFHDKLTFYGQRNDGEVSQIRRIYPNGYLAVQLNKHILHKASAETLGKTFDQIHHKVHLPVVFFRAANIPFHDSLEVLKNIQSHMTTPSQIFETEHVWYIVALIRYAKAVVGTSLHVRIMAFVHAKPRVTFCGQKYLDFIRLWDAKDATPCINHVNETLPALLHGINTPAELTYLAQAKAIQTYMEGFRKWSSLLLQNTVDQ